MIEFPLQLRRRDAAADADGWLLPTSEVREWVKWLAARVRSAPGPSLLPIAGSRKDPAPLALFVVGAIEAVAPVGRALPYRLLGGRLFVPADAELCGPLSDAEFAALFPRDVNVLHPRLGLTSGDEPELLKLADLLRVETRADRRWNCAHAGLPPLPSALRFSVVTAPVDLQFLADGSHEEIGTEKPDAFEPDSRAENPGMLRRGAQGLRDALRRAVLWFTSRAAPTATRRTWINRLEDWANQKLGGLEQRREREIARLVNLLRDDPDQGLKRAFPIGGDNASRGRGAPGANLPANRVDFDLNDLAGGGPADPWGLGWDQLQKLSELYRRSADRELSLRRFRRAAYIYAKLLNDYESAAQALRQGGYFREAAALYRGRLAADKAAAECLRAGGLHEEAAAIYEELGEFELLGDMLRELKRESEARAAYEQAVELRLSVSESVAAARLLDGKLGESERAKSLLWDHWPDGPNAASCLDEYFSLLDRDDERSRIAASMARVAEPTRSLMQRLQLGELLGRLHERLAIDALREDAADHARVLLGAYLRDRGPRVEEATRILGSLAGGDRLLDHDTRAFARARLGRPEPSRPAILPTNQPVRLRLIAEKRMTPGFDLQLAVDTDFGPAWLGAERGTPRIRFPDAGTDAWWPTHRNWQAFDAVFVREPKPRLYVTGNADLERKLVRMGTEELPIETSRFDSTAFDPMGRRYRCVLGKQEGLLRRFSGAELETTMQFSTEWSRRAQDEEFGPLRATGQAAYVGLRNRLYRLADNSRGSVELPAEILRLVQSPGQEDVRLMFHMGFGAGLFRDVDNRWDKIRYFASDMAEPLVEFLPTGHLLAANADLIRVYTVGKYEISRVAEIKGPGRRVVCVLSGPGAHGFRIFTERMSFTYELEAGGSGRT